MAESNNILAKPATKPSMLLLTKSVLHHHAQVALMLTNSQDAVPCSATAGMLCAPACASSPAACHLSHCLAIFILTGLPYVTCAAVLAVQSCPALAITAHPHTPAILAVQVPVRHRCSCIQLLNDWICRNSCTTCAAGSLGQRKQHQHDSTSGSATAGGSHATHACSAGALPGLGKVLQAGAAVDS
jgi:hypothetical protein